MTVVAIVSAFKGNGFVHHHAVYSDWDPQAELGYRVQVPGDSSQSVSGRIETVSAPYKVIGMGNVLAVLWTNGARVAINVSH